jgi:ubiquitin carboxyl-terminal hydrolase 47
MSSTVIEVMVKVHVVDLKAETVAAPVTVRAYLNQTVTEFKQLISKVSLSTCCVCSTMW